MKDPWFEWPRKLRESSTTLLTLALEEDLGEEGDLTARYFSAGRGLIPLRLVAREAGVLAGMPLFLRCFRAVGEKLSGETLDPERGILGEGVEVREALSDGSHFEEGDVLARFLAPEAWAHPAERTALNFLQRLSGVATRSREVRDISVGPLPLDTRKTTPGFRLLEKYAVRTGGSGNHRMGLHDAIMVKDNHKEALGGIARVMDKLKELPDSIPVILEVDHLGELEVILEHELASRVKQVLLDNFDPRDAARALELREAAGGGPDFEISGGLRAEDLANPLYRGIEFASLGELTHQIHSLDLALEVDE
ncbi:MAG: nicotinate-nucleotide diphosphorylase (carboxylating) [Candidatus Krumholzibacteria bacterium]|jgi:nicotinate-nucleotide pyrophosphorylase (carboxylating)|nr:nicotinate-nucleotide diphosphorylase (carboxylating) [Candidatus Krumholzibacteria bacterium]MDP6669227.1 nicotinate-nucleotide diphosphorylase (carboxylating) [Candidatus Krumholzibacteria bacterium]MDP6796470.1 nicotinate-nucleotide diphosphorylase (carboxylating) [Candidatus Krumholzibacteria bacterium]MDP7021600.1 nicotinate-nucleotide diphosphorylase (carboxylating) [Candidatus Krumholzibacteria bacterium]